MAPALHTPDIGPSITHVHFAFGRVDDKFTVSTSKTQAQFENFRSIRGKKRVLAFGGWTASTDPSSYWIFREGVKPGNRETLSTNLADFVKPHQLDGIDLDWEYPGAPDQPEIPPAEPINGPNYLELLMLERKLPGKSLSIAAPASYWYLKAFPIDKISQVVDYIVYMTRNLHGQWDYGSSYSSPGCPEGNCLRSRVNVTETITALSMITKGGIPASKIVVGVGSYGRSFCIAEKGCTGSLYRYIGVESGAKPGQCTQTAGYISNAEIQEILKKSKGARTFKDESGSKILIYDDLERVAYMGEENKTSCSNRWKSFNFLDLTDQAVDLQQFTRYDTPPEVPPEIPGKH